MTDASGKMFSEAAAAGASGVAKLAASGVAKSLRGSADAAASGGVGDSVKNLYTPANIAKLTAHSWNVFRYMGDYMHLFGVFVLLLTLAKNKSCVGISRSTQILYFLVFISRYLDLFDHSQTAYLVFFKITYMATSFIALVIFWFLDSTYERQKDTCSLSVILIPCATAAVLLAMESTVLEVLWSFSQFLEGFAMVPQYIFCYRDRGARDIFVFFFVICLGGYRVFYAANWIYKKVMMPQYSDVHSWFGGVIEITFFVDFLLSRVTGFSVLRAMVLKVDEKINEVQNVVGSKVLGSKRSEQATEGNGECELRQRRRGDQGAASDV